MCRLLALTVQEANDMTLLFADFVVDVAAGELRRGGKPIKLEPQVFDLIAFLAGNSGRVLSKHDIAQSVWHGRAISDSAISTRINVARRALGDDRDCPTVH
jgi:DNA-binding winged helix-turn-helix (wHTH) protein